ncbi:MAG: divergent polysaccharide deacetylase family protein [Spirochaetota bacterium]|nr:divergent polysaccharide deacetylase family protein [Spirochaetota bacterium]
MKIRGTLPLAVSAAILSLVLFTIVIFKVNSFNFFNDSKTTFLKENPPFNNEKDDWIIHLLGNLGKYEALTPVSGNYFQKDIYLIKSKNNLSDYKTLFEKHLKEKKIRFNHRYRKLQDYETLIILFEEKSDFLRIIEIRKSKGKLVHTDPKIDLKPAYISIVIDDVGRTSGLDKDFLSYPYPLTFAIIPFEIYTQSFARKANKHGKEVIIHAPMEGGDKIDSHHEISAKLTNEQIAKLIFAFRKEIPTAVGFNNHRGSVATIDKSLMERLFRQVKKSSLYFLDSKTNQKSHAASIARSEGIPTLERDIFLDNKDDVSYISSQMYKLIRLARKRGNAIGIGHFTKANTLSVLRRFIPYFKEHNIHIIPLSNMIRKNKEYVAFRH